MWEHSASGSAGAVLNKPTNNQLGDLVNYVPSHLARHIMFWGGPVHTNLVFMLHSSEWSMDRTSHISETMAVTSDNKMFEVMEEQQPDEWKVLFGHSSWGPGQLEGELEGRTPWSPKHSWLVLRQPSQEWIFNTPTENMWDQAILECSQQAVSQWL